MALRVEQAALAVALVERALLVLFAAPLLPDQPLFDGVGRLRLKEHVTIRGLLVRDLDLRRDVLDVLGRRAPDEPFRRRRAPVGAEAQCDRAEVALAEGFELGVRRARVDAVVLALDLIVRRACRSATRRAKRADGSTPPPLRERARARARAGARAHLRTARAPATRPRRRPARAGRTRRRRTRSTAAPPRLGTWCTHMAIAR